MLIYDGIFSWEGWGGRLHLASGKCRLRIFDLQKGSGKALAYLRPIIVIVSDVAESRMSVRSCSGHVATRVTQQFNIDPHRMLFIEYCPKVVYGEKKNHVIAERYDAVEFSWHAGRAMAPKWRTLKPPLLDVIRQLVQKAASEKARGNRPLKD